MMDNTTKEIAGLLRSTDEMAVLFVERIQARVREPVSDAEVLAAMKKVSAKTLTMDKVIAKVQQQQKTTNRRTGSVAVAEPAEPASTRATKRPSTNSLQEPRTLLQQLAHVLSENWNRAEAEGLDPERMTTEAFVSAIYQFTDRREGTRLRILKAAKKLDDDDVMLTPALVADVVHELYES